jgi:hypothetical protein
MTTFSAIEERKAEEEAFFQAKISQFNRDRRQLIKRDDVIREFLLDKKAKIYEIIEHNMSKLKIFPRN